LGCIAAGLCGSRSARPEDMFRSLMRDGSREAALRHECAVALRSGLTSSHHFLDPHSPAMITGSEREAERAAASPVQGNGVRAAARLCLRLLRGLRLRLDK